jgi:hypothetical protein
MKWQQGRFGGSWIFVAFRGETMPAEVQAVNRVRDQARTRTEGVEGFDYSAPAELFPSRSKKGQARITYKRFETAAEAIRYAIEDVPPPALLGAYLEVEEARYGMPEIQYLYERAAYPLKRREAAAEEASADDADTDDSSPTA